MMFRSTKAKDFQGASLDIVQFSLYLRFAHMYILKPFFIKKIWNILSLYDFRQNLETPPRPGKTPPPARVNTPPPRPGRS